MNQRIIYQTDEGGVAVIIPAPKCGLSIEQIAAKDVPAGKPYKIVDVAGIPSDRTFRNAWKHEASGISIDMVRAVDIQKDNIRKLRAPKLVALDTAYMRALEQGNTEAMADIAAQKQVLRDATKDDALTAAKTPDELKAVLPEALR